jgi:ketopantoate reductase
MRVAILGAGAIGGYYGALLAKAGEVGRRLEVEALSGAVVRRGRTYDIPMPVHQAIWASLSVHQL